MFSPRPRVGREGVRVWPRLLEDSIEVEAKGEEVEGSELWLADVDDEEEGVCSLRGGPDSCGSEAGDVSTMRRIAICKHRQNANQSRTCLTTG